MGGACTAWFNCNGVKRSKHSVGSCSLFEVSFLISPDVTVQPALMHLYSMNKTVIPCLSVYNESLSGDVPQV